MYLSEVFGGPLGGRFSSKTWRPSVLLPLIVLPLDLSPKEGFSEGGSQKGVLRRPLEKENWLPEKFLEGGCEKGASRSTEKAETRPFVECDPLGVRLLRTIRDNAKIARKVSWNVPRLGKDLVPYRMGKRSLGALKGTELR